MGFNSLRQILIRDSSNLQLGDFPLLPNLKIFQANHCKGLNEWTAFPILSKDIPTIDLKHNELNNEGAERILKWIKRGIVNIFSQNSIYLKHLDKKSQ